MPNICCRLQHSPKVDPRARVSAGGPIMSPKLSEQVEAGAWAGGCHRRRGALPSIPAAMPGCAAYPGKGNRPSRSRSQILCEPENLPAPASDCRSAPSAGSAASNCLQGCAPRHGWAEARHRCRYWTGMKGEPPRGRRSPFPPPWPTRQPPYRRCTDRSRTLSSASESAWVCRLPPRCPPRR